MARHGTGLLRSLVLTVAAVPALALASAAHAAPPPGPTPPDGYNATINQGNVPTTAAAFSQDCNSGEFADKPAADDGWLFVASPSNFQKLQAQFKEGTVNFDGTNTAQAYYTKVGDHVAVITPGGWTLTQAFAELDGDRNFFVLSHTCAATTPAPQQSPPSATTGDHSCDSVTFSLSAGSHDTTFTVTPTNGTGTDVAVATGTTKPYTVSIDSAHPGATVTADGSPLDSYTRPASCDEDNNGGGGDNNGGGGDNNGGGDVGATGGSTGGSPGSTGGGTTSVLGEKLTKTPHTPTVVEATKVATLPMTGYAASHAVELGALLCLLGFGAIAVGRRRVPTLPYIKVRN